MKTENIKIKLNAPVKGFTSTLKFKCEINVLQFYFMIQLEITEI